MAVVIIACPLLFAQEDTPRTTDDSNLYLFVDDHWIEKQQGVTRVFNQAQPLNQPIVAPDDPKTETDCAWGNVIREADGKFRLWYCTMTMGHNAAGPHEMAAAGVWGRGDDFTFRARSKADHPDVESMLGKYAESDDGITWRKPNVGLIIADSIPLITDAIRAPVQWKTKSDLSSLRDKIVRIALRLRGPAIVYALAIPDEQH